MARRRIAVADGRAAVQQWESGDSDRRTVATAVRYCLEELAAAAPGNSVEVRVPPFGVTQCIEGPSHSRGTPPNVVELSAADWLSLATGTADWETVSASGRISASGTRADLSALLPLHR